MPTRTPSQRLPCSVPQVDHSILQREINASLLLSEPRLLFLGGINSTQPRGARSRRDAAQPVVMETLRNFTGDIASE